MTFHSVREVRPRLVRSALFALCHDRASIESAASSQADSVIFELEDAVPVGDKEMARSNVIESLGDLDWGDKVLSVRVNALDSPYTFRDVIALLEAPTAGRIDLLFLPKVGVPEDVYAFDVMVTQVERDTGREDRLGFDLMIESTLGMTNAATIGTASSRVESLQLGAFDYANSAQMRVSGVGGPPADYAVGGADGVMHGGDPFHYPVSQVVAAARATGLRPIDGPYTLDMTDFDDASRGFEASARRGRVLGCEGKQCLGPDQAAMANTVFSPTEDEVATAQAIADAADHASANGVVSLDGQYIDTATVAAARATITKAQTITKQA